MSQNELSLQTILNQFVDDILGALPISDVTPEQREMMRDLIINRVDKRLISLIIQELPENEFQNILSGVEGKELSDDEEMSVIAGAIDHIPDFAEKLALALETLRTELTEDIVDLKNSSTN